MIPLSEYLLDDTSSRRIPLPDGRKLGYAEYGASTGVAVICLHGLPGSRIDFARFDEAAKLVGARIISVDRPGIGLSSPDPRATVLSIAADVGYLTDNLGLDKYAVLGGSAGGPYALACASALPKERLKVVALLCSPGKSAWPSWLICQLISWTPSSLIAWHWRKDPGAQTQLSLEKHYELLHSVASTNVPHERETGHFDTKESLRIWLTSSRETFNNGMSAIVQDTYRLAANWGLDFTRIDMPIRLWYGRYDGIAPVSQGKQYAAQLGNHACLKVLDETHGSMFANQSQALLEDIVSSLVEK